MSYNKEKRGPGRPRKKPLPEPPFKKGIVNEPERKDNHIELIYDDLEDIKKINTFLKNLNSKVIMFKFRKDETIIKAADYLKTNKVKIVLNGANMISYYCLKPIDVYIKRENLDLVLQNIDKQYIKIAFAIKKNDINNKMYIIIQNAFNYIETFGIDLILDWDDDLLLNEEQFDITEPPIISFTMKGKFLKKLITGTKNFTDKLTFQKLNETSDLSIKYTSKNTQVDASVTPLMSKDISLQQNFKDNKMFAISIYTNNLRATSSSNLSEELIVNLWANKPIQFFISLNEGSITFNILVDIIDYSNK